MLTKQKISSGSQGWVQLRLEEPVVARARDRIILRTYSPMITIGGGVIAEPQPVKRKVLDDSVRAALENVLEGEPVVAVKALLSIAAWYGIDTKALPVTSGLPPGVVQDVVARVQDDGGLLTSGQLFSREIALEAERLILRAVPFLSATTPLYKSLII